MRGIICYFQTGLNRFKYADLALILERRRNALRVQANSLLLSAHSGAEVTRLTQFVFIPLAAAVATGVVVAP